MVMNENLIPNYPASSSENSLSARVYEEIKAKILDLSYHPGSYLTEARLADEYGVSRMPIRIAIQKLSNEGWLVADFRRKLQVKDITKKNIEDIYALREILETQALRRIFDQDLTWKYSFLIEEKLLRMKAAKGDFYKHVCADAEMHFVFIGVFDNERIEQIYRNVCDEIIRICLFLYQAVTGDPHYFDTIIAGVEEIVRNIREKNYDQALFYLRRDHFSHSIKGTRVANIVDEVRTDRSGR